MAKNKEVFEYQAKVSVDIGQVAKTLGQVKDGLMNLGGELKIPKHFISDLSEAESKAIEFQKNAPGAGSSERDLKKYASEMQKLVSKISIVSDEIKNISFSDDKIQKSFQDLKNIVDMLETAKNARDDNFKIGKTKIPDAVKVKDYTQKIKDARAEAIAAAEFGFAGATPKSKFKEVKSSIAKDKKKAEAEGNQERVKELNLAEENIKLLEREIEALRRAQEYRRKRVESLEKDLGVKTSERRVEVEQKFQEATAPLADAPDQLSGTVDRTYSQAAAQREVEESAKAFDVTAQKIKNLFSATTVFYTLRRIVQGAIRDFQELDKQFNEIAIVSDYSTAEMWKSFSSVNKIAQEFGVTTKNVLEVQNLYYHQGKDMAEVNKLTAQTLTLAKITGMDYANTTSHLTAILNAYNIAAEDAVKVTDSIAAMDTNAAISSEELSIALTKTASIAANAGMSLESTEIFLTKMIETTREAPENLGTALKTIVARFGEVKQEIDGEEIELADVNKVDTALKSIGISLLDTAGQIRDLDDVFMELSAKWDDLDRNTQRYIATQAAGSRQQSRFIAMMEDYDRTLELTNIMQTSAGIGASQLEKSMESLESSLNRLKSTWQEFYSEVIPSSLFKNAIDGINALLKAINGLPGPMGQIVAAIGLYTIKTQVLDRLMVRLAVSHDVITGKIQSENMAQEVRDRLAKKRETSFVKQIAQQLSLASATEKAAKEAIKAAQAELLKNAEEKRSEEITIDRIKQLLIEKGMTEELAEAYVEQTLALKGLNREKAKTTGFKVDDLKDMENMQFQSLGMGNIFKANKKYSGQKAKDAFKIGKNGVVGGLSKSLKGIGSQIAGIAGSIAGVLPYIFAIAAVIAIIAGTIYVIYKNWAKNNEVVKDNTKSLEELNKQTEEYNKQLEKSRKLKSNVDEYKELQEITVKTTEQLEREQEISKEIADEFPILLDYIDEEGNYRLKNIEHLDEEIKKQKQLTLEAGETNAELQRSLALKGIVSADDTQVQGINTRLQGLIQELELTDKDTKTQAATISKKITGQRGYGTHQGNEIIQGFLDGTKSSISMGDLNEIFGATDLFTEDNIDDFFEAAKGKDLSDIDVLRDVFSTAGIEISKADTSRFYKYLDYIPEIGAFITEQWGKVESANKTAITNALSLEDFNFEMSAKDMAKFGEIFAGAETQDAVNYFKNMSEDEYNSFIDEYLNLEDKKIGELDEILTTNLTGIEKILAEYRNKQREILIEKRDKLEEAGLSIDFLNKLTSEQIAMMSSQFSELASKTNESYAGIVFQELFASAEEAFGKDTEKFNDFINIINSADLSSPEGVEAFQKKLYELGYSTDDVYKITLKLAGGIKNLPLRDAASQIESINKELEETEKVAKSIGALLKGEGSFEDITLIAKEMANAKIEAKEILAFYQSIQMTMNGFKMSQESLNKYANVYLGIQKKIAINKIQGYMTDKADLETEKSKLNIEKDAAKIKELNLKIEEAEAQIEIEKIGYYSIQLELKKQMVEATLELMEAELAATQKFADSLANLDRFAGLNTILERLSGLEDSYEFNVEFSMNADVIADNWEKQIDNINNQLAVNQAGRAAALDEQQKWQETITANGLEDYVSFKDGAAIVDQNKLAKLYEERYKAELALANGTGSKYEVEKYDTIINLIEKSATGYNNAAKAYETYTKGAQDNAKKLVEINNKVLEAQSKAMEEFKRVTIEAEDAHLEAVKEKYGKMKEEDQKYLDSVRRMIDKERELRDRENNLKNIKDKEKKLAMMKMDTSGVYAGQIRELEDELAQDYQDFEDSEIDRAINEEEERFRRNAELWDKETEYIENVYEERRKTNQYYWDLYEETAKEGTDAVVDYMTNKSIEYQAKDEANQVLTRQQWTQTVAAAQAAGSLIQKSQDEVVIPAINRAQQSAEDFDDAIQEYADSVTTSEEPMRTTISNLAEEYKTLATRVNGVAGAYQKVIDKFDSLIPKAETLLGILQDIDDIEIPEIEVDPNKLTRVTGEGSEKTVYSGIAYYSDDNDGIDGHLDRQALEEQKYYKYVDKDGKEYWSTKSSGATMADNDITDTPTSSIESYWMVPDGTQVQFGGADWWGAISEDYVEHNKITINGVDYVLSPTYNRSNGYNDNYLRLDDIGEPDMAGYHVPAWIDYYELKKYATGGYVDYTGPAWVDGTKSHPEYMLNATQTAQFESLVDALSMVYEAPKLSNQSTANSQKTGDSHMEFHINVEGGISSDYDVDKAVERIEKKILDSGKYRNTTVIKKSN